MPPGREAYTCCLNPVRRAGAFELLLEKTEEENLQSFFHKHPYCKPLSTLRRQGMLSFSAWNYFL